MKRSLIGTLLLTVFGMAFAGPPVDYQLTCDVEVTPVLVGVASLVEDQLHVALIAGALEACPVVDDLYVVSGFLAGAETASFQLTFDMDGLMAGVAFVDDPEYAPDVNVEVVPEEAVAGKLGAQQNRAEAFARAQEAHERAQERAGGPGGDDDEGPEGEGEDEGEGDVPGAGAPGRP